MYRAVLMLIAMANMGAGLTSQDLEYETLRRECIMNEDPQAAQVCLDDLIITIEQDEENRYKWALHEKVSLMDDSTTVALVVSSRDPNTCRHSRLEQPNLLALRCLEDSTSVLFSFEGCLFGNYQGYNNMTIRLDKNTAEDYRMETSYSKDLLALYGGRKAIPFIKNMFDSKTMLVRFRSINGSTDTISFDISGLEEAIQPLREACHW